MSTSPSAAVTHDTPLQLGELQLRNRVIFAPCTRNRANVPGKAQALYYSQRASGGLLISEGVFPEPQGYDFPNAPGIYTQEQIEGHKLVTDAVHKAGGLIVMQVMNIGRTAHPLLQCGQPSYGPSAIGAKDLRLPRQLAAEAYPYYDHTRGVVVRRHEDHVPVAIKDPWTAVESYRRAFASAKEAGYDGVEVHGASGYLVNQFLDSRANQRDDEWGGSPVKRCKFALEVVKAAIDVWGAGRVGIKLSPSGTYNDMGMSMQETMATYTHLLAELEPLQIAYVHIQRWLSLYDAQDRGLPIAFDTWRRFYAGNLLANGGYTPEEGAAALAQGEADGIVYGRYFIANPDLVQRIREDLPLSPVDWTTGQYEPHPVRGYTDYKRWEEMSDSEREVARVAWQQTLAEHAQEREVVRAKLAQQKLDAAAAAEQQNEVPN